MSFLAPERRPDHVSEVVHVGLELVLVVHEGISWRRKDETVGHASPTLISCGLDALELRVEAPGQTGRVISWQVTHRVNRAKRGVSGPLSSRFGWQNRLDSEVRSGSERVSNPFALPVNQADCAAVDRSPWTSAQQVPERNLLRVPRGNSVRRPSGPQGSGRVGASSGGRVRLSRRRPSTLPPNASEIFSGLITAPSTQKPPSLILGRQERK